MTWFESVHQYVYDAFIILWFPHTLVRFRKAHTIAPPSRHVPRIFTLTFLILSLETIDAGGDTAHAAWCAMPIAQPWVRAHICHLLQQ